MSEQDADRLYEWVQEMNVEQLHRLWRWVILAWAEKAGLMGVAK